MECRGTGEVALLADVIACYHLVGVEAGNLCPVFANSLQKVECWCSVGCGICYSVHMDTQVQAECQHPLSVPAAPLAREELIFLGIFCFVYSYGVLGCKTL